MTIFREGWLRKEGRIRRSWKRRYCVLIRHIDGRKRILYYKDIDKADKRGYVDLNEATEITTDKENAKRFEIKCPNRVWKFEADNVVERIQWLTSIKEATEKERSAPALDSEEDIFARVSSTEDPKDLLFGANRIRPDSGFQKTLYTPIGSNLTIRFSATPDTHSHLADITTPPPRESIDWNEDSFDRLPGISVGCDTDYPKLPSISPPPPKPEVIITQHKMSDTTVSEHMDSPPSF